MHRRVCVCARACVRAREGGYCYILVLVTYIDTHFTDIRVEKLYFVPVQNMNFETVISSKE